MRIKFDMLISCCRRSSNKGKAPIKDVGPSKKRKGTSSSTRTLANDPKLPDTHGIVIEDEAERVKFATIVSKEIESTCFPSKEVLVSLGLYDNLKCLFDNIGWGSFLDEAIVDRRTYKPITLEILSTIEIGPIHVIKEVPFQLFGERRVFSLEEIDDCYGVPHGGLRLVKTAYFPTQFWDRISTEHGGFRPGFSKTNEVVNPVLRMALKIIAHTILARKENTSVRVDDLFILEGMLTRTPINFCHLFLLQLRKHSQGVKGVVTIGGMLTPWARRVCDNFNGCPHLDEKYLLDLRKLSFMHFLVNSKSPFFFLFHDREFKERLLPLPNAQLVHVTDIHDRRNWKLDLPSHTRAIYEGIFNFGGVDESVGVGGPSEGARHVEESDTHTSTHGEDAALGVRLTNMENRLFTIQSTFEQRFNTMDTNMESHFTTMNTQVNRVERGMNSMVTLFEQFRDFQVSQGLPWPRPPPS